MGIRNATFLCTALALAFFTSTTRASTPGPASALLSTSKAGAKHVTLTVSFRTELQCGRLMGSRTLVLLLPSKERVAVTVPVTAVLVGGRAAGRVTVAGHALTVSLPPPRGMMCDSVRMGVAKIVVAGAAGLGNPRAAGTYTVKVTHGSETFAAPFTIH